MNKIDVILAISTSSHFLHMVQILYCMNIHALWIKWPFLHSHFLIYIITSEHTVLSIHWAYWGFYNEIEILNLIKITTIVQIETGPNIFCEFSYFSYNYIIFQWLLH